jgi:hypothetical protein
MCSTQNSGVNRAPRERSHVVLFEIMNGRMRFALAPFQILEQNLGMIASAPSVALAMIRCGSI